MLSKPTNIIFKTAVTFGLLLQSIAVWGLDAKAIQPLQKSLGFFEFYKRTKKDTNRKKIRIAIFDNSFAGYKSAIGKSLPTETYYMSEEELVAPDEKGSKPAGSGHGRFMAETVYALMSDNGQRQDLSPELYLFSVTGYTNLKDAIDECIRLGVEVILQSMVREYGSNFDGRGFFNTEVNRAIDNGILWVNAAGNFGKTTYHSTNFILDPDGWVKLPGPNDSLPIVCEKPKSGAKECQLRLVLGWTDFSDDPLVSTKKDLDLELTVQSNDQLYTVNASRLTQSGTQESVPGFSRYPREIIEASLPPGRYFVRVKIKNKNIRITDSIYIASDSEFIKFENYDAEESIFNPADNPNVITVGASDSDRSSQSVKLNKPEILSPSRIVISDNEAYIGSSTAAAVVTAGVGLLKLINPDLNRKEIIADLTASGSLPNNRGSRVQYSGQYNLPSWNQSQNQNRNQSQNQYQNQQYQSQYQYQNQNRTQYQNQIRDQYGNQVQSRKQGPSCLEPVQLDGQLSLALQDALANGGVVVQTAAGLRVVTSFDPIVFLAGWPRVRMDDMILATPAGYQLKPRMMSASLPQDWIEIVQLPTNIQICSSGDGQTSQDNKSGKKVGKKIGKMFHL